ncbi:MAG: tetratricopeptide repeat protein [Pseudomonadota bacterium]
MINKEDSFNLNINWYFPESRKYAFTFITLFVFLTVIYANSFHCGWFFDDHPNIVENTNVHIESLSLKNIVKTFYVKDFEHKGVIRPLSYLTFALNYYVGGFDVFGYHVVNFTIHYIAAIFLFLFIYNALQLPILNARYENTAYSVALLSAFFWATHPLQITAVTYIVQRMASMAGMFYIMAMYFYLKARVANKTGKQTAFFALCGISAILSFASKENAAMLPVSLYVFDLFLIQGLTGENVKKNFKIFILPLLIVLLLGYLYVDLSTIFDDYKYRPFTLIERLLTEPRVILFYVSLILYPTSSRLMLLHDTEISRSLLTPWTTFPAIFGILFIIGTALFISRKRPLIAYCILFFFINHVIEGSIIPLELIYEHTNYTPSMLLFVPVAMIWVYVIDYFSYNRLLQSMVTFVVIVLISAQGHTTYLRNDIFKDGISLWEDNTKKAGLLPRTHHGLGAALLSSGFDTEGIAEHEKALKIEAGDKIHNRYRTHFNLGTYYFYHNEYDKAYEYLSATLRDMPDYPRANNFMAMIMISRNELEDAEKFSIKAIRTAPGNAEFYRTLSLILLKKGDTENGIKEAIKAMMIKGNEYGSFYLFGEAYRLKNELPRSVFYFTKHLMYYPGSIAPRLALIELYFLLEDTDKLKQEVGRLIKLAGPAQLPDILIDYHRKHNCLDDSRMKRIILAIEDTGCSQLRGLNRLLQEKAFETKKKPGPYKEPGESVYYEK